MVECVGNLHSKWYMALNSTVRQMGYGVKLGHRLVTLGLVSRDKIGNETLRMILSGNKAPTYDRKTSLASSS